ncbi:hypothetical protein [Dictyobacter formicarum]|uniref:Uncharacterized protein n=1 Tax=Dictyobacter formicarum TaxID=2778368 RepID=A0ABQ3VTE2_9CHLR|nr:hypothetical protein [Dictyobacter formicarum]GHO88653.1 hypothetical protein KSZ_66590 [Dictyobacter formicarum]
MLLRAVSYDTNFCSAHDLSIEGWPMHEVTAHPQAAQVIKLFHDLWNTNFLPET